VALKKTERLRSAVARIGEEIQEKAWTVGRDPVTEKRKRLAWGLLQGFTGGVLTLAARRAGTKVWAVVTGEPPPAKR
jgi:hypothetical protein